MTEAHKDGSANADAGERERERERERKVGGYIHWLFGNLAVTLSGETVTKWSCVVTFCM